MSFDQLAWLEYSIQIAVPMLFQLNTKNYAYIYKSTEEMLVHKKIKILEGSFNVSKLLLLNIKKNSVYI